MKQDVNGESLIFKIKNQLNGFFLWSFFFCELLKLSYTFPADFINAGRLLWKLYSATYIFALKTICRLNKMPQCWWQKYRRTKTCEEQVDELLEHNSTKWLAFESGGSVYYSSQAFIRAFISCDHRMGKSN